MAGVEHCATEGSPGSPYYFQLSYFTIYLTKGIEILEYYTKVPFYHVLFEAVLVIWIYRLITSKTFRFREQKIELTEKEEEELIEEWQPEPLVPATPTYDLDVITPKVVEGKPGHTLKIDDTECLNFATFNFLGFVGNDKIEDTAIKSLHRYGVGSCGPRGFYGTIDVHLELEERLAKYTRTEEAILYSYGFSTIASAIPAYSKRGDVVFCDKGVSFAIQKGLVASRSRVMWFEHNDMEDLERLLLEQKEKDEKNPKKASVTRRFLIVEGIYVNYGDIAPLPKLMELKYRYKVRIFIDESASFGVLGHTGRGLTEHFNVPIKEVDLVSVSMENSLATIGGFCCGTTFVVDHQRISGAGYCFSASLPPMLASAAIEALNIMEQKPDMFGDLREKAKLLHAELDGLQGLVCEGSEESPIKHLRLLEQLETIDDEEDKLKEIVAIALRNGVALTIARYLKDDEKFLPPPSIRVTVNVQLTKEEIKRGAQVIRQAAEQVFG
ncbi:serine palmitoyltransferase 1-like [Acropora millepora]|uniref:serine palmitoyltransferase 1-like n=1 Tax=Acropora millepora TaxID=45264 RepID=UPI001CF26BCB|nr:serine palmitoyltransferase 1-like [Acropora millepora]